VILWDLATGTELVRLGRQATRVAFSPKDSLLATGGGADRQVSVWNVDLRAWADRAGSMANRNLSLQEWRQYLGTIPYRAICPTRPLPAIKTSP
jgi:WD40 repeat protein